jgi:hypothetical protein
MASDLTIVVADVTRKAAIASTFRHPGRIAQFTNLDLPSALEAVRTHQPGTVVVDAVVVQTQQGLGFIRKVEALAIPGCTIRLINKTNGVWTTTAHEPSTPAVEAVSSAPPPSPIRPVIVTVPLTGTNTRRAPRFPLLDSLDAEVEGGRASLVNISVLGAQVVSNPVLRPGQTVKIALPNTTEVLRLTAQVAWSTFEQGKQGKAVYRAGVAFTDATQEMLEQYCRSYGGEQPLPSY